MIDKNNIKHGMKAWYGHLEYYSRSGGNGRVDVYVRPQCVTVRLESGNIELRDNSGDTVSYSWRRDFNSSYGDSIKNSLYETKEELIEAWNNELNYYKITMEKNFRSHIKRYIENEIIN